MENNFPHRREDNSSLYFSIGLALILSLVYLALEWKSYATEVSITNPGSYSELDITEPQLVINLPKPAPPKLVTNPPVIKIEEDDALVKEIAIDIPEQTNLFPAVVDSIVYEEPVEDPIIMVATVQEVPIFPGCEQATNKRECFESQLMLHIKKTFKYPPIAVEMGIKGKVHTQFVVNKQGEIEAVQLKGPHRLLEAEAERIIKKIPKLKPAKQNGKEAKVIYSIPIKFDLHN